MTLYPKLILDALATVRYPGTGKNLVEAEMVADNLRIDGMSVSFSLIFEKPTDPFMKSMIKAAETAIHTYVSPDVQVAIATESRQAARPEPGKLLPLVKNVIAVSSGKGGVYSLLRGLPTQDVVVCTVGAAIVGGMVIWMHRTNIQRIRDGKEYRFGQKHKSK